MDRLNIYFFYLKYSGLMYFMCSVHLDAVSFSFACLFISSTAEKRKVKFFIYFSIYFWRYHVNRLEHGVRDSMK